MSKLDSKVNKYLFLKTKKNNNNYKNLFQETIKTKYNINQKYLWHSSAIYCLKFDRNGDFIFTVIIITINFEKFISI